MNRKFIQIQGPFAASEEVVDRIKLLYPNFSYIKQFGVQALKNSLIVINNDTIQIGSSNVLELEDVCITSIKFLEQQPASTLIDCIVE